jgi:predicted component of type VI protein secretion system
VNRKYTLIFIFILTLLSACSSATENTSPADPSKYKEMNFERIPLEKTPKDIQLSVTIKGIEESTFALPGSNGELYVMITRGEKASTGYEVNITKVENRIDHIAVIFEYKDPLEGEEIKQTLTYPSAVITIENTGLPIRFKQLGERSWIDAFQ